MVKPVSRSFYKYSLDALALLGQLVREARLIKAMTTTDLASRAGISRALLQRIERGDLGVRLAWCLRWLPSVACRCLITSNDS